MATPSLTWWPVFLLERGGGVLQVPPPHYRAFYLRSLSLSPERLSSPRSLVHSESPPQPPTFQSCLFPFFLLALRASILFPQPTPDHVPFFPPKSSFPPRSLFSTCDSLILPPKWDWGILTWALLSLTFSIFCNLLHLFAQKYANQLKIALIRIGFEIWYWSSNLAMPNVTIIKLLLLLRISFSSSVKYNDE